MEFNNIIHSNNLRYMEPLLSQCGIYPTT